MKRSKKFFLLSCVVILLMPYANSFGMVFPGTDWVEMPPESQGIDSSKLNQALNYLESKTGSDGIREVVVIRNGYMIWKGDNIDKKHGIWSCTKIFTSAVMGLLVDDEKCDPATLAKDFVPSLSTHYSDINLAHFATMTSGYDATGGAAWGNYLDGSYTPWIPTDPLFTPGEAYLYWDDAVNMMGHVLTQIAQESIYDLFKRRIADSIGMNPDKLGWGNYGIVDGFLLNGGSGIPPTGIEISAREMAKFGHLFLNRGNWAGSQVISTNWVDEATQNHVSTSIPLFRDINTGPEFPYHMDIDKRGFYGYHWMMNGINAAGNRHLPDAPLGTFYRSGWNDNIVVVVPEWGIVIVRLGLDEAVDDAASLWNDVLKLINEAFLSPVLTLLSPNGGERLNAGETFEITWTSEGDIENVKIEYSVNNGTGWIEIEASTENDGFYIWEVPCDLSDESLVAISDVDGDAYAISDEVFSIEDQDYDNDGTPDCNDGCLTDPNKTAPGQCGCGTPDTDSDGDGTADCNDNCPNDPNKIEPGLCGCGFPDIDFCGIITVASPNGGEVLNAGEPFEITWTSEGDIENVKIEYSANNGTGWIEIIESTENDGSYILDVPFEFSDECLARISDVDGDPSDESDAVFSLTPPICEGDFDDDGDVDGSDLAVFAADFGRTDCSADCEGDFDTDNDVDGSDLAVFAADFGRTDCP